MDRMPPQGAIPPTGESPAGLPAKPPEAVAQAGLEQPADARVADALASDLGLLVAGSEPTHEERVARLVNAIEVDIIPRLVSAYRAAPAALPSEHRSPASGSREMPEGQAVPGPAGSAHVRLVAEGSVREPPRRARVLADAPAAIPADLVAGFIEAVEQGHDAAMHKHLNACLAVVGDVEALYTQLLTPAAQRLGELWCQDKCHFADVTIGVGRLHQVLRSLSPSFVGGVTPQDGARRILLTPAPGEQHVLGLSMVADYFARDAWDVVFVPPQSNRRAAQALLMKHVQSDWFDVIGVSVGSSRVVAATADLVQALRRASRNRAVGILVGGSQVLRDPNLRVAVGADGAVSDATAALAAADALLESRLARADLAPAVRSFSRQA